MRRILKKTIRIFLYSLVAFLTSSILAVALLKYVDPPVTVFMLSKTITAAIAGKSTTLKHKWVQLEQISPHMITAVVASEDNLFTSHNGFDLESIKKAKEYNTRNKGKKMRGASTISQQVAKNVFLWPQRSWLRKGLEAYFTILIEMIWDKRRIMEIYLNVIETGKGMYGVQTAAGYGFGKSAERLTRSEAALIAAILPNPARWDLRSPTAYIRGRQQWILWNMSNIGKVEF